MTDAPRGGAGGRGSRRLIARLVFWAAIAAAVISAREAAFARNRLRHPVTPTTTPPAG